MRKTLSSINNFIKQDGQLLTLWKRKKKCYNAPWFKRDYFFPQVTIISKINALGVIHTAMCLEPAVIIISTINLGLPHS